MPQHVYYIFCPLAFQLSLPLCSWSPVHFGVLWHSSSPILCFPSLCCSPLILLVVYKRAQQEPDFLVHFLQSQAMHPFSCFGLRNISYALQIQASDESHTFNFLSDFTYCMAAILNSGWLNWCLSYLCTKLCLLPVFLWCHGRVAFDLVLSHHL